MKLTKPILAQIVNPLMKDSQKHLSDPADFFSNFIQGVFSIFMVVGVLYFIFQLFMSAYNYITTEGDKNKLETAKSRITHAFLGIGVLFSVFALLKLIGLIFGIDDLDELKLTWPSLI